MQAFFDVVWDARFALLAGLGMTVLIAAMAVVAGTLIGLCVGLVLSFMRGPLYWLVRIYVDFIRGTPVLVLILASFYILGTIGWKLSAVEAGILALAIFCSSHVGEITRGALGAIPEGQAEAAKSLGLNFVKTFLLVLLPQATRIALPAWVNTALDHWRRRAAARDAGGDRPQLHGLAALFSRRPHLLLRQFRHRAIGQSPRAATRDRGALTPLLKHFEEDL
jgi:polar amino acid transport system permease protein